MTHLCQLKPRTTHSNNILLVFCYILEHYEEWLIIGDVQMFHNTFESKQGNVVSRISHEAAKAAESSAPTETAPYHRESPWDPEVAKHQSCLSTAPPPPPLKLIRDIFIKSTVASTLQEWLSACWGRWQSTCTRSPGVSQIYHNAQKLSDIGGARYPLS